MRVVELGEPGGRLGQFGRDLEELPSAVAHQLRSPGDEVLSAAVTAVSTCGWAHRVGALACVPQVGFSDVRLAPCICASSQSHRGTVRSRAAAYRSRIAGTRSASYTFASVDAQTGGAARRPASRRPGWRRRRRHTPRWAEPRLGGRVSTGRYAAAPRIVRRHPPRGCVLILAPWRSRALSPSASPHSRPSIAARARCAGVLVRRSIRARHQWRRAD